MQVCNRIMDTVYCMCSGLVPIICGVPSQVSTAFGMDTLEMDKTSHLQGIDFVADRVDRRYNPGRTHVIVFCANRDRVGTTATKHLSTPSIFIPSYPSRKERSAEGGLVQKQSVCLKYSVFLQTRVVWGMYRLHISLGINTVGGGGTTPY